MSLLDELSLEETWKEFRDYKSHHSHMSNRELAELDTFIRNHEYLRITDRLRDSDHGFSFPQKRVINKSGTGKKRVIYMFPEAENRVLKLLTWLLYRYDSEMSCNCYSFRREITAKDAFMKAVQIPDLDCRYTYKTDIHDYFNSMPVENLKETVRAFVKDDPLLLQFLCDLLSVGKAIYNQNVIAEERGAMAGSPLSAFFANIYLNSLDREFEELGIPYFRYSDDIIVFAKSEQEREMAEKRIKMRIAEKGLVLNPEKEAKTSPGESWNFLGFSYNGGRIDLAQVSLDKMKAKIRRKCRSLYRWKVKKNVDFDRAAKVVLRVFNRKFYDIDELYDFTWSRWFFPILNTDGGLHALDAYLVSELRYLYSGRHYKGNYVITYEHLKELGFRSLVNEYYKFKKEQNRTETGPK